MSTQSLQNNNRKGMSEPATLRTFTTSTTSANGLSTVTKVDNDGNGVFELCALDAEIFHGLLQAILRIHGKVASRCKLCGAERQRNRDRT